MYRAIDFFRGSVCIEAVCDYPERFLNICIQNEIEFWNVERISDKVIRMEVGIKAYQKLRALTDNKEFHVRPVRKKGMPFFLWHLRKRYVLLAGLVLTVACIAAYSMFIWEIDISGCETVSEAAVLEAMERAGVKIGTYAQSVEPELVRSRVLYDIKELSWFIINVHGTRAEVIVRERTERPELIDESVPTKVVAVKSGIISRMNVYEGEALYKVGDTVQAGDVLVSGEMESISSGTRYVHAMADVYARTWYELSLSIPLLYTETNYTGEVISHPSLCIAGKRLNLYFNAGISVSDCDKISLIKTLRLPTGNILPIQLVSDEYHVYEKVQAELTEEEAEAILRERILQKLSDLTGGAAVVSSEFSSRESDGIFTLTMTAECLEQIAKLEPLTADTQPEMSN